MSQLGPVDNAAPPRSPEANDAAKNLELVQDLIDTLTVRQRDLLIGLSRGSPATIATLRARIPKGTRELLESHNAIDALGKMTPFGELIVDQLVFQAGEGLDPELLARAAAAEAKLLHFQDTQTVEGHSKPTPYSAAGA